MSFAGVANAASAAVQRSNVVSEQAVASLKVGLSAVKPEEEKQPALVPVPVKKSPIEDLLLIREFRTQMAWTRQQQLLKLGMWFAVGTLAGITMYQMMKKRSAPHAERDYSPHRARRRDADKGRSAQTRRRGV